MFLCAPAEIANFLSINRGLVCRLKGEFDKFEGPEEERMAFSVNRKPQDFPKSIRTEDLVENLKAAVIDSPSVSMKTYQTTGPLTFCPLTALT